MAQTLKDLLTDETGKSAVTDEFSDEELYIRIGRNKILDAIAEDFGLPVTEWGISEWKAVAQTILTEKVELGLRHKVATKAGRELWDIKDLLTTENKLLLKQYRSGGTPKKGKEYEPKTSIRKICEHIKTFGFEDVLNALRDADLCLDWYESTTDPTGVLFIGVDDDEEEICYLRRGALPDNQDKITFKRLRDTLTEIKK